LHLLLIHCPLNCDAWGSLYISPLAGATNDISKQYGKGLQ
jgi:hypothetical protein